MPPLPSSTTPASAHAHAHHRRLLAERKLHLVDELATCPCQTFARQSDALVAAQASDGLHVFSRELSHTGARDYLVTTFHGLYVRTLVTDAIDRHYYEVIVENLPCHLYLDIEAPLATNTHLTDAHTQSALMTLLRSAIISELALVYGVRVTTDSDWVELDSSDDSKFSRHVIVRLDASNTMFATNIDSGHFVRHVLDSLTGSDSDGDSGNGLLYVRSKDGTEVTICVDTTVYTKNRSFRLLYSRKCRPDSPVLSLTMDTARAWNHRCSIEGVGGDDRQRAVFLASCVQYNARPPTRLLRWPVTGSGGDSGRVVSRSSTITSIGNSPSAHCAPSVSPSTFPFPRVLDFICSRLIPDPAPAFVRSCQLVDAHHWSVVIGGSRYCANKERAHRSNGVYVLVDLQSRQFSQRCFDRADCGAFRSTPIVIPSELFDGGSGTSSATV